MSPDNTKPPGITRREAVLATAAVVASTTLWGGLGPSGTSLAATTPAKVLESEAAGRFLAFSKAITGHDDIDALTSSRIHEAMGQADPSFAAQVQALVELAQPGMAPDALLAAATSAGLRGTALSIVAAWYTGTVVAGGKTAVVAYEDALMYRPVADGLTVPTYCNEGPLWWTAPPPPAGLPAPQQVDHPSPSPPPVMRTQ